MPVRMKVFLYLVVAYWALESGWSIYHLGYVSSKYGNSVFILGALFDLVDVAAAWFVASRRQGWLRWLLGLHFLFGLHDASSIGHITRLFVLYVPNVIVLCATLYCTFGRSASAWFDERPVQSKGQYLLTAVGSVACGLVLGGTALTTGAAIVLMTFHPGANVK